MFDGGEGDSIFYKIFTDILPCSNIRFSFSKNPGKELFTLSCHLYSQSVMYLGPPEGQC